MAAVAAHSTAVQPKARRKEVVKRAPTKRRPRAAAWKLSRIVLPVLALAFLFGYVNVYANLAVTNISRSKLVAMCTEEKIKNERLKIELARRSSPHNIVAVAQEFGMVYATEYDYLDTPRTFASARKDR